MLSFCLFEMKRKAAVPVCNQLSEESRWELVQRSCNLQLQTSVEKCDVRSSNASPRVAHERKGRVGEVTRKVVHA